MELVDFSKGILDVGVGEGPGEFGPKGLVVLGLEGLLDLGDVAHCLRFDLAEEFHYL